MLIVVSPLTASEEQVVTEVVDCGFQVHSVLGPGFKERIYVQAFSAGVALPRTVVRV